MSSVILVNSNPVCFVLFFVYIFVFSLCLYIGFLNDALKGFYVNVQAVFQKPWLIVFRVLFVLIVSMFAFILFVYCKPWLIYMSATSLDFGVGLLAYIRLNLFPSIFCAYYFAYKLSLQYFVDYVSDTCFVFERAPRHFFLLGIGTFTL